MDVVERRDIKRMRTLADDCLRHFGLRVRLPVTVLQVHARCGDARAPMQA